MAAALAAPVARVVLVTGADAQAVADHAREMAARLGASDRLDIVHAPDWDEGMSASLKRGVAAAAGADGVYIFLGDMPRAPVSVLAPLATALSAGAAAAAPVCGGQRGHPCLLGREIMGRVAGLSGDRGAASLLGDAVLVETDDDGVLFDVDRPPEG